MSAPPTTQAFLEAAAALYKETDPTARGAANDWLQQFQQTPDAWKLANDILLDQAVSLEPRLLAAITFHKKVVYDLSQLPDDARVSLRDTLLVALQGYARGPRVIQSRICLALSALALQMPGWANPVGDMIARFGQDPATVDVLLEFLTVLPEEVTTNSRIPIDNEEYQDRVPQLLGQHVSHVLGLLEMYLTADGVTTPIQASVFRCMQSWIESGEVSAADFAHTGLLAQAITALGEDTLFDEAVDVLCVWIKETQEWQDNLAPISTAVPLLIGLAPQLKSAEDDEDRFRGFTRVFSQVGEVWSPLFVSHPAEFQPLVEVLLACSAYSDLDIVRITFRAWSYLASAIWRAQNKRSITQDEQESSLANGGTPVSELQPLRHAFQQLQDIIIRHLRFPYEDTMSSQERDDFRDFRHAMGDTLKDCCDVLGAGTCLQRSLQLIQEAMNATPLRWQDIEAPLFSMRAMGSHVDPHDEVILPQIMDLVPHLPPNPRLKYAGLLVLGRYTEWVAAHPDRIPTILNHVSQAFDETDVDVHAAAARALRFLCIDCRNSLGTYLPQLFQFFQRLNSTLSREELLEVSEAVAFIISALPAAQALESLLQFVHPVLTAAAELGTTPDATPEQLRRSADALKQVDLMMRVNQELSANLPAMCASTAQEAYLLLDSILQAHGESLIVSESVCALIRRGIAFFGQVGVEVVPALVVRMAETFQSSGHPAYVWIIGASISNYGLRTEPAVRDALRSAFHVVSQKVFVLVQSVGPRLDLASDVIEDYVNACALCVSTAPWILILSPYLVQSIHLALSALNLYHVRTVQMSLQFLRDIIGQDCLLLPPPAGEPTPPPAALVQQTLEADPTSEDTQTLSVYAAALRVAFISDPQPVGPSLVHSLLQGLVGHFDPEEQPITVSILRMVAATFGSASVDWVRQALDLLSTTRVGPSDKQAFLHEYTAGVATNQLDHVRTALLGLYRAARRTRDRVLMDRVQD